MQKTALVLVGKLQKAGYEAYFAGGCVRDMLMETEPSDYDIATSARPEEIERVLKKTIPVGKQFGVILAEENGHHFEVATFRSDSSSSDGRRPDAVIFTHPEEDARRRDFTINGLFYDPVTKKVFDFVDGQKDLAFKLIRFIGDPEARASEDHLRILRAVRFKNQLDFTYHPDTERALKKYCHFVEDVSKERVQDELTKMLLSPRRAHAMRELDTFEILDLILPEVTACKGVRQPTQYHQEGDVFTHLLKTLHSLQDSLLQDYKISKELVWAVFLHDIGKPATFEKKPDRIHFDGHAKLSAHLAGAVCRRLKFSRAERLKIEWLIEHHMTIGLIPKMRRAHQLKLFMHLWFRELLALHWCDESGSVPCDLTLYRNVKTLYDDFKNEKLLPCHLGPLLDGKEVMDLLQLKPGPKVKEVLAALHEAQLEGEVITKEEAVEFTKKLQD